MYAAYMCLWVGLIFFHFCVCVLKISLSNMHFVEVNVVDLFRKLSVKRRGQGKSLQLKFGGGGGQV